MKTCQKEEGGKESITIIKPIKYNKEKDLTLIEAIPLTGRQHQIRVHLHSIGHTILGDPIYGKSPYLWDAKGELICMQSKIGAQAEKARFDTDSGTCGIDNRASASTSPYKADFTGPLIEEKRVIRGFEGSKVYTIYKGTLLLSIQDDDGVVDEVQIPNSYHVPTCPYRIISPQHWAQEVQESTDDGTGCVTYGDRAVLFWKGGTRKKTVMIDKQNVFTFDLPSGYKKFHAACATCLIDPLREDEQPAVIPPIDLTYMSPVSPGQRRTKT